jgi:hypothetical protein
VSEDRAQQNTDAEEAPDVLRDVSNLEVKRITLEFDDLRAHVSVLSELANLVSLSVVSVGAGGQLGRDKLEIEGIEAQAHFKVRLEHVRPLLEKALDTVREHPEILETLSQPPSEVLRQTLQDARAELDNILEGLDIGDTVDEVLKERLDETRGALGEADRRVRHLVDESGTIIEQTLDESRSSRRRRR